MADFSVSEEVTEFSPEVPQGNGVFIILGEDTIERPADNETIEREKVGP